MTSASGVGRALLGDQGVELLTVRVGTQEFAIDIMSVREIRGWSTSTPLPHAPKYVRGMVNLRGLILAIIDLSERLGLSTTEPTTSSVVVVVENGGRMVGLLVDAVCDIIAITDDIVQNTPDLGSTTSNQTVQGLLTIEGRIVSIISIPAIMPDLTQELPPAA